MLEINSISHYYGETQVLDNVSLQVAAGELTCLLGRSGCGKSTLLRLIAGLEHLQHGNISNNGVSLTNIPAHLRNIGMVFQHPALFPHLNVTQNIQFGLRHKPKEQRTLIAKQMLQLIKLQGLEERFPHQLSGGQHQRVALARTLAPAPIMMLLDEPFANLDNNLRINIRTQIAKTLKASSIPIMLVTHDPEEALAMADNMVLLGISNNGGGTILQQGTAIEVYHQPKSLEIASFFSHINVVAGVVAGDEIHTQLGIYPRGKYAANLPTSIHDGASIMVCTRPEGLRLARDGETSVRGVIEAVSYSGVGWLITARLSDATQVQINHINVHSSNAQTIRPNINDNIAITLQPPNVFIFPVIN